MTDLTTSQATSRPSAESSTDTGRTPIDGATTPVIVIKARKNIFHVDWRSLWDYRELLYFLTWRDVKVRYKQTAIGAAWAILQPLTTMVIFTVIFGRFARIPSDGLPYPIFAFTALLPWTYFASALTRCTTSIVGNSQLISKIYFPRLILPLSGTFSALIDFAISFMILIGMMAWFGIAPTRNVVFLPLFLLLAVATTLAVGLWLSALNVRYRDVGHAIPFLIQCWMYASPVAYPVTMIPERWRLIYSLNPMAGVIEGFRWALLGKASPDFGVVAVSALIVTALLLGGLVYFRHLERTFADVI
jgi:lipopolysaccharide transport system permease protein